VEDLSGGNVLALDVGGTSVKSVAIAQGSKLLGDVKTSPVDSRGPAEDILDKLADVIQGHAREQVNHPLQGVALGFPGPFDYEAGICLIKGVAKFESLYGLDIRQELWRRMDDDRLPMRFRNDAEAATVGEALYGSGRPFVRQIGLTLGTGCGSAFLVAGRPVTAGPGVPANGWLYPISFRSRPADERFSIRGLLGALRAAGVSAETIKSAAELARRDHLEARQVFVLFGRDLGAFLLPWSREFEADAVILQGGIANAFDLFGAELSAVLPVTVRKGTARPPCSRHPGRFHHLAQPMNSGRIYEPPR
jgi:glucokinase